MNENVKEKGLRNIGINVPRPKEISSGIKDKKCPFTGEITVKKESHVGKITRRDVNRSATIAYERSIYVPKYERYEKRISRLRVHNPQILGAEVGDTVKVMRTRPLSKTKHFVIVEVIKKAESR